MADTDVSLVTFTAEIVSAYVGNNRVATADVGGLVQAIYRALEALGAPEPDITPEKPKGAVSARASIKPEHLVSMIDGKPYKMLRRHIGQHGYTPESYRDAFGLPRDYPMTAASYAEQRRALAHKIGLGRERDIAPQIEAEAEVPAAPEPAAPARRGRKPKAATEV